MLHLLLGKDWISNRNNILKKIATDVQKKKDNIILIVPELISHDMERRLCEAAGDTASRYCEVLSFSRLAQRIAESTGHNCNDYLDNGGRIVAMAAAVRQIHGKLKAYASLETKPEFLSGLVEGVDEFKCCCIKPSDLFFASKNTGGVLAQKLEEIAYIYEAYDALCSRGRKDPRDLISWMLDELEDSVFASEHTVYIDGFPDFTEQNMRVISHFIECSPDVYISLNCDRPSSTLIAFEKAGKTAQDFLNCAKRLGIETSVDLIEPRKHLLTPAKELVFEGDIDEPNSLPGIYSFYTETAHQECTIVAERIVSLIQSGCRYRDIGVVCADISAYKNILQMMFRRFGIPVYLSGTDDLLEKNVISAIFSAVDAALGSFEQRDVFLYLKSILSPLTMETVDLVENYAYIWKINGLQWVKEWKNHPNGLQDEWSKEDYDRLALINDAKYKALLPIERLRNTFMSAVNVRQQVEAIYSFFTEIHLAKQLDDLANKMDRNGDNRSAQILFQLWDILLSSLEQMHSILGEIAWDTDTFTQLFKLLLSQYDVGTIPPVLDSVSVGAVASMRCQEVKHLFVVGAVEGCLPTYVSAKGVLSDAERRTLRGLGVPVNDGSIVGLQAEFAEIYGVFCGASDSITISYATGEPSFIYKRLSRIGADQLCITPDYGAALTDKTEAAALLARYSDQNMAQDLGIDNLYKEIQSKGSFTLGTVSDEGIFGIYGDTLHLSASQIDRQAQCRLSYFLNYGLKIHEWKTAEIDPSEFGTYVHDVLENTVKHIMEKGGFKLVSKEETSEIAKEYSRQYALKHFSQIDTERLQYVFNKNILELDMIVMELWQEMQLCDFVPMAFELGFGAKNAALPPIAIPSKTLKADLKGFVDRVDIWEDHEEKYFRVVDYKTGKKNFDYCDVFNGIGLQMLLYMFALEQEGSAIFGKDSKPAGVMYFPARAPYLSMDNAPSDDQLDKQRASGMKRKGLLLNNVSVLNAMESLDKPKRLPISKTKDGTISGDVATPVQMDTLKEYVFGILGKLVDDIASGNVSPNPYLRGNEYGICTFCPYGQICHKSNITECRNYKTVPAQKFWDDVGKEVKKDG